MDKPVIMPLRGFEPKIGKNCYIAPNASIIGDVHMGDGCSIWFSAVLRGDVNTITLGNNVNVQDNATLHGTYEKCPVTIGNDVTIGHNAVVHGATICDMVLIGMNSTVLDNAVIASGTVVAAGALILSNTHTEPNSIYAGVPAKKIKDLTPEQVQKIIGTYANNYAKYAKWYTDQESTENQ